MIKETECIARLFKLTDCYAELVDFMMEEKILSDSDLVSLKLEHNKPKFIYDLLKQAEKDEQIMLLSFDWVVLPVERIRIRLITGRSNKELTYKY